MAVTGSRLIRPMIVALARWGLRALAVDALASVDTGGVERVVGRF
jgi:hypothetical protein